MGIEVLATTMHQTDLSKYKEMNLQTDAVLANQTDCFGYQEEIIDSATEYRLPSYVQNTKKS